MKTIATLLLSLTLLAAGFAHAAEPLTATLEVRKVLRAADGKETFAAAATVLPADVVEYRTTYRNTTERALRQVVATLPIPTGYHYIAGTASRAQASLDGKTYAPMPLTRVVKGRDGQDQVRLVPVSEYRFLRWSLGDLQARSSSTVAARVQLADQPATVAAR